MDLYIFDENLNRLGILDKYESLIWTRKTNESGVFELHCSLEKDTLNLLKKGNIIFKSNDLTEGAYIQNIYLNEDTNGIETLQIIGKFITGYIGKRIIWNTETINNTVENAIRQLINNNCINTVENRKIPMLELGEFKGYTEKIDFQVSYKNLEEKIITISNEKDINFRIITDIQNKKHKFDVYKGIDRTVNQNINPICIFSSEFENLGEQSYSSESDNIRNVALVGGAGEKSDRIFTIIGDSSGLDREEIFVDADDIRSTRDDDTTISRSEYIKLITQRGLEKLNDYKEIINFESKINVTNSNLIYKRDFDLGDYVTCVNKKWNIMINVKITEIEEVYEKDGMEVNVVFGDKVQTIVNKLERRW